MRIEIKANKDEEINWKDLNKIFRFISKDWDVKFKQYLGDNWEIYATKKKCQKENKNEGGQK